MTRSYEHVMLDLETLGTTPGATVLSIGLCPFDVRGVAPIEDRLHRVLSRSASAALGLIEDPVVLGWWGQQSWEAQATLRAATEVTDSLNPTLLMVETYLARVNGLDARGLPRACLWGNGAGFDQPLLAAVYTRSELPTPWAFYRNRCFRTLKSLELGVREPPREGTHHNALDDAVHQARWAVELLRRLASENDAGKGDHA